MAKGITPCAATFQDAYHYALAAAHDGDSAFWFEGARDKAHGWTKKEFLENAAEQLRKMGFTVATPGTLRDAKAFADNIDGLARVYGIDAFRGEKLCKHCGQKHPSEDHDYEARQAAKKLEGRA